MTRPASAAWAWAMQAMVAMAMKVALRMIFFLICHYLVAAGTCSVMAITF
jgi:hypothetical protein